MNKIKTLRWLVVGLIALNLCVMGYFLTKRPLPFEGPKEKIIDRLGLNPQQVVSYERIIKIHRECISGLEESGRAERAALYGLLSESDQGSKDDILKGIAQNQRDVESCHFEHFEALKAICNESQMAEFKLLSTDFIKLFAPPKAKNKKRP